MRSKPDGHGFKSAWETDCPNLVSPTPSGIYLLKKSRKIPVTKHESESDCKSGLVVSYSLQPHGLYRLYTQGQNAGMGSLSLLQKIFPTQELSRSLLHEGGVKEGIFFSRWEIM